MNIDSNIIDCTFTIKVIDKLTLESFYDFLKLFQSAKNIGSEFTVDFRDACHVDVSRLGMLLMLCYLRNICIL